MALREYLCKDCDYKFDWIESHPEDKPDLWQRCHSQNLERQFPIPGGYSIHGSNSASTSPKGHGSRRRK